MPCFETNRAIFNGVDMKIKKKAVIFVAVPIILVLLYLGFNLRVGQTFIMVTAEPAEDFVVLCTKRKRKFLGHTSTHTSKITKVIVTKSGVAQSCGYFIGGEPGVLRVMHPTLVGNGKKHYVQDGVLHRVYDKTKLDVLDEQKAKFEAGYWDKSRNPGGSFLGSRPGCGFPHQYFDYYKQVRDINIDHFKVFYQKSILECLNKSYKETRKHDPYLAKKLPEPSIRINQLWVSIKGEITK